MRLLLRSIFLLFCLSFFYTGCQDPLSTEEFAQIAHGSFDMAFEEWDDSAGTIHYSHRSGDEVPYLVRNQASDGDYSVVFGVEESSGMSRFRADVSFSQDVILSFKYKRSEGGADLSFLINNGMVMDTSSSASEWTEVSFFLTAGEYILEWEHLKDYDGDERAWIDGIRAAALPDFSEAFEELDPSLVTISSIQRRGEYPYIDSTQAIDGDFSVLFGVEEQSGTSSFQADFSFSEDVWLSFKYKRTEGGADLKFFIDDETILSTEGAASEWTEVSYYIPAGEHTLKWEHRKWYDGAERAWIDGVRIISLEFDKAFEEWNDSLGTINSYSRNGGKVPYIDPSNVSDGEYSVIFGEYWSTGTSSFSANVTLSHDVLLSFKYKRSGGGADLMFLLDGVTMMSSIASASEWTEVAYFVPAGEHTLEWEHRKYHDVDERAWIDGIRAVVPHDFSLAFEEWDDSAGVINSFSRSGDRLPYIDQHSVSDGVYSVVFGEYTSTGTSSFQADVSFPKDVILSFKIRRSESGADLFFHVDNDEKMHATFSAFNWREVSYYITAGDHILEWLHKKYYDGSERAWIDGIGITALDPMETLFEEWNASTATLNSWDRSGAAIPRVEIYEVYSGDNAIRFGDIDHNETSSIGMTISVATDSTLSFYYCVSSEEYNDYFRFYLNGSSMFRSSGVVDWTEHVEPLSAGVHTLEWMYSKDNFTDRNRDTAWVDNIIVY